ncbi:hypothetical protein Tco_0175038 [Tanacetum coccineum]
MVLMVGTNEGSCDQQALETDRIQLKDTITSLRIQLDGLMVENVSLKRRYDELSKANTHSLAFNLLEKLQSTGFRDCLPKSSKTNLPLKSRRKPMQSGHTSDIVFLHKSVNARRAADTLGSECCFINKSVCDSCFEVYEIPKTPHAKHSVNILKRFGKATEYHNVNILRQLGDPTWKIVGSG